MSEIFCELSFVRGEESVILRRRLSQERLLLGMLGAMRVNLVVVSSVIVAVKWTYFVYLL